MSSTQPAPPQEDSSTPQPPSRPTTPTPKENDRLMRVTQDVVAESLSKVAEHLRGELVAATEDYKLLEHLNSLARDKYAQFGTSAQTLVSGMSALQQTYTDMDPFIHQIFDLERQVGGIEAVVAELDDYTRRLEEVFKKRPK